MGAVLPDIAALSKHDRTLLVKQAVNGNFIRCTPQQAAHGPIEKMMPRQEWQETAPPRVEQFKGTHQLLMPGINPAATHESINSALPVLDMPLSAGQVKKNIAIRSF
jgi:hypothetical protein